MKQVRDHCLAPARAGDAFLAGGRYMRLFPELPPLAIEPKMLRIIGGAGGSATPRTAALPTPARSPPPGRYSASTWPTTSRPTARR